MAANLTRLFPAFQVCWLIGVVIFWFVPMFLVSSHLHSLRFLPARLRLQYAVAGLFTEREGSWNQSIIIVRDGEGMPWKEVERSLVSKSELAGYRHRIDRLLPMAWKSPNAPHFFTRLGRYVEERYRADYPGSKPLDRIAFINTSWKSSSEALTAPYGHWAVPPLAEIPDENTKVLAEIWFREGLHLKTLIHKTRTVSASALLTASSSKTDRNEPEK